MNLAQLYLKYQNSGLDGNPIITDEELETLKKKLMETWEFSKVYDICVHGLINAITGIENTMYSRKFNGKK